jgi:hypothetical protein
MRGAFGATQTVRARGPGTRVAIPSRVSAVSTSDLEHGAAEGEREHERQDREETLSVAATSLAAVATAWSAFQAATWSGRQTFALLHATKLRQLSSEARLEGDQQQHLDASLFVTWAGAYAHHDERFAQFLYDRFPPRLKTATDAWLATKPLESKDAPPHPLLMQEYRLEAHQRAATLAREADDAIEGGHHANVESDTYVLGTVVFATIILLASLGARLRRPHARRVMLVVSLLALLLATGWLAFRPVAWIG